MRKTHIKKICKEAMQDEMEWLAEEIVEGRCPVIGDINDNEATLYKLWPGSGYYTEQYLVMGDDDFYGTESELATWLVENAKKGGVWYDMHELRDEYGKEAEAEGYEPGSEDWWDYVDETYNNQFITLGEDVAVYAENMKFQGVHEDDMRILRAALKKLGYKESKKQNTRRLKKEDWRENHKAAVEEAIGLLESKEMVVIGDLASAKEGASWLIWPGSGYFLKAFFVAGAKDFYSSGEILAEYLKANVTEGTIWWSEDDVYTRAEKDVQEYEGLEPGTDEFYDAVQNWVDEGYAELGEYSGVMVLAEQLRGGEFDEKDMDYIRQRLLINKKTESKKVARSAIRESVARLLREAEENTDEKKDDIRSSHEYSVELHIHVGDGREVGGGVTEANVELFLDNRYNRSIGYIRTEKNGDSWYIPQDQHGKHDEGIKLEYGLKEAGYEILKAYLEA